MVSVRKYLEDIRAYLKKLPVHNAKLVGVGSEIIGSKHLKQMLKDIDEHKVSPDAIYFLNFVVSHLIYYILIYTLHFKVFQNSLSEVYKYEDLQCCFKYSIIYDNQFHPLICHIQWKQIE